MFSKENRRFTTLVVALVIVVIATMNGVSRAISEDHANSASIIVGVSAMVILQFVGMIRQEMAVKAAERSRDYITDKVDQLEKKTNGNLNTAIKTAAEEVKKAVLAPAPGQEQMPRTPDELQSLIKLFVREMSDDVIVRASTVAAKKAAEVAATTATETITRAVVAELEKQGCLKLPGRGQ